MGVGEAVVMAITVLIILASTCFTVVVGIAITVGSWYLIRKLVGSGGGLVIQTNLPIEGLIAGATTVQQQGPQQIKRVSCRSCGAAKMRPPTTAYLYCDYCGALIDWDFKIACQAAASAKPGPEYERLNQELAPRQAAAVAAGDQGAYRATLEQLWQTHLRTCPASYSPRLGDPQYHDALLKYMVDVYLAAAFDDETRLLDAEMRKAVAGLQWVHGIGGTRVEATGFKRLIDSFRAHNARFLDMGTPYLDSHPDQPNRELLDAIGSSAFVQGWLPYLDQAAQDELLGELGLAGEYVAVEPVETTERHCGGCGKELHVVAGARRVVCEICGHTSDVERPEIPCAGCGVPVSIPVGKSMFSCPSCQSDMRVEGTAPH